jgi:hypothetical protein
MRIGSFLLNMCNIIMVNCFGFFLRSLSLSLSQDTFISTCTYARLVDSFLVRLFVLQSYRSFLLFRLIQLFVQSQ